jgi:hypothetical protein
MSRKARHLAVAVACKHLLEKKDKRETKRNEKKNERRYKEGF